MPMYEAYFAELNREFGAERIQDFAAKRRDHFGPDRPLELGFLKEDGTPLQRAFSRHLAEAPGSMREALRGVIHHALSTDPPTPVTFAWAPGYDYEMTLWQSADAELTRGGITVLIKSRYPVDPRPKPDGR